MHEAYAVHRDGQLVGFDLPVERAYAAAAPGFHATSGENTP